MTPQKKEELLGWAIFFSLISHYWLGYFFWGSISLINIYYLTAYWCMDIFGLTIFILARESKFLKGMGALAMALGTFFFYMEFNDPKNWKQDNIVTLIILLMNTSFIWIFTEKIKTNKK